jgi:hypothetical protein
VESGASALVRCRAFALEGIAGAMDGRLTLRLRPAVRPGSNLLLLGAEPDCRSCVCGSGMASEELGAADMRFGIGWTEFGRALSGFTDEKGRDVEVEAELDGR